MIDIAFNLTSSQFDHDRDQVVARAQKAGVHQFLLLASELDEVGQLAEWVEHYPGCYMTAGCHPHQAESFTTDHLQQITHFARIPQMVAVGECGLDYNRNFSDRAVQRDVFAMQLDLAIELQLPVLLHEREAHDDFMAILAPRLPRLKQAVIHCFTGSPISLARYLEAGLYIGITGWICDERRGKALQQMVGSIPNERLFLETDAPYLLPRDLTDKPKSRRNEPCYLPHIYQMVASLRGQDVNELVAYTQANFAHVFGN